MAAVPGKIGPYKIIGKIAEGGMGKVFKAMDEESNEVVAIKTLPSEFLDDRRKSQYLRREFEIALKLNHPNVVNIIKLIERPRQDEPKKKEGFLMMEWVDGWNLRKHIKEKDLNLTQILDLFLQICKGLSYIHLYGIVHRDIKPENILISKTGKVKIADFGLSTAGSSWWGWGKVKARTGTPRYMSPEQLLGKKTDVRSDIYSLGLTIYEVLTGQAPYEGRDGNVVLQMMASSKVKPRGPSELNPKVPPTLNRLVLKCLEKKPKDRYQSTAELQLDLERLKKAGI